MLFTSYGFIGFLAVLFLLYYLIPAKYQWMLLLAASYLFYWFANPVYLLYICVTTVSTWFIGRRIEAVRSVQSAYLAEHKQELDKEAKKSYKALMKKKTWHLLLACLFFNLGILAVVKYTNFVISNVNAVIHAIGAGQPLSFVNIIVPLGISFYTFQAMGYIIDVYRGTVKAQDNLFRFALFVSFFPQLVQGPISRYGDLSESLFAEHPRDWSTISMGLQRMLWGYFKKLVIADRMLIGVNTLIQNPDTYYGAYAFLGMLFYALELYADFTGGIDITIGIAQVLGVKVTENFNRPYFSKSIKEYWNRWHMTMGSWFTDYIFYPISVCKPMLKLSKASRKALGETIGKRVPIYLSSFVVWFATGIWHGASWNFIVWGLANCFVILVSQELEPFYRWFHSKIRVDGTFCWKLFRVVRTVLLMSSLRTFDCYRNVPLTFCMYGTMFTEFNWGELFSGSMLNLGLTVADYAILLAGLILLIGVSLLQRSGSVREKIAARPYPLRFAIWFSLFLMVILWGTYGIGYDASQFIYNQF
ncbi:MAG: MBOAT family O-acyltransferase [Acetatifactor sp.]|nr:MBOAT family O-acyltransferase [Acetatifactor sp.]